MNDPERRLKKKDFSLRRFTPYRLAVLDHEVSSAVAQLYDKRFNLSRQEWRVLAALGENKSMTAKDIVAFSTLDKMQVSRAVAKMLEAGLVASIESAQDRRRKDLALTKKGKALYREIIPHAEAREAFIMERLSPEERAVFDTVVDKLIEGARKLRDWG